MTPSARPSRATGSAGSGADIDQWTETVERDERGRVARTEFEYLYHANGDLRREAFTFLRRAGAVAMFREGGGAEPVTIREGACEDLVPSSASWASGPGR